MKRCRPIIALTLALAATLPGPSTPADRTDARQLERTVDETVEILQSTQASRDAWAGERAELTQRYRALTAQVAFLEDRRDLETGRVNALEERVAEYRRRLEEADRLQMGLQDSLVTILRALEEDVREDLPFLAGERSARLASVRSDILSPDISPSEKLRRLLEALQIEAQYGSTVEVTAEEIEIGGASILVDMLRVGRLSLFWRSPDGGRGGEYDPARGEWIELDGSDVRRIGRAMEMVERRRPHELIALPLGRIAP